MNTQGQVKELKDIQKPEYCNRSKSTPKSQPGPLKLHRDALKVCSYQEQELKKRVQSKALKNLEPAIDKCSIP